MEGTAGNEAVSGTVTFEAEFQFAPRRGRKGYHICNVRINARVNGLTPGKHGFHVHTYGDVRASDGTSTGDHFTNPAGVPIAHGYPSSPIRHWGDFGNLIADNNGVAVYNAVDTVVTIPSIIGRAVTIHAGEDKGPEFQPSGDSGSRVGVCVIGLANPDIWFGFFSFTFRFPRIAFL